MNISKSYKNKEKHLSLNVLIGREGEAEMWSLKFVISV